jgi:hypothetical protein
VFVIEIQKYDVLREAVAEFHHIQWGMNGEVLQQPLSILSKRLRCLTPFFLSKVYVQIGYSSISHSTTFTACHQADRLPLFLTMKKNMANVS